MNLEPVRDALLADARRDAEGLRTRAERDAAATVAAGSREAERLLAEAHAAGEAEARAVVAADLAQARREAREVVLRARRDVYERTLAAARDEASALRHAPRYDALVDGLTGVARQQLGDDTAVIVDDEVGGLLARAGARTVDYRLPAIAERCFGDVGPDLEALWR